MQTIHTMRNVRCDKEHVISQSESVALNEDNFTSSPPSGIGDDFGYPIFNALVFLMQKTFELFGFKHILTLGIPDEGCSRNVSYAFFITHYT